MISIVIPTTGERDLSNTLNSIKEQTYRDHEIIIQSDPSRKGANWARNEGVKKARGEYVFLCDDDIILEPWALEKLLETIKKTGKAYSYGWFYNNDKKMGDNAFNEDLLKRVNYISTMSLVRKELLEKFKFDESFKRFQDWDLWLTLLENGHEGAYCGYRIFTTKTDENGLSSDNNISYYEAVDILAKKHKIGEYGENRNLHAN